MRWPQLWSVEKNDTTERKNSSRRRFFASQKDCCIFCKSSKRSSKLIKGANLNKMMKTNQLRRIFRLSFVWISSPERFFECSKWMDRTNFARQRRGERVNNFQHGHSPNELTGVEVLQRYDLSIFKGIQLRSTKVCLVYTTEKWHTSRILEEQMETSENWLNVSRPKDKFDKSTTQEKLCKSLNWNANLEVVLVIRYLL